MINVISFANFKCTERITTHAQTQRISTQILLNKNQPFIRTPQKTKQKQKAGSVRIFLININSSLRTRPAQMAQADR